MNGDIVAAMQYDLEQKVAPSSGKSQQSFFKEEIKSRGLSVPVVEKLARERFKDVRGKSKEEIFSLCEALLKTDYMEEAFIAFEWSYRLRDRYEPDDFPVFDLWLSNYVNNWAKCDTLCNHTIGAFVEKYPEYLGNLKVWAKADNRWLRRGAAVTLVLPARKGLFLDDVFDIADILLTDQDDLVRKGYGWMLKEAARQHQREVFDYVMKHKDIMPRTALRYAIEKMPDELKRRAMAK